MKVHNEMTLEKFDAWSGGKDTKEVILENRKGEQFDMLVEELYPDGLSETELNDILWFEREWIYSLLNIREE
tara:strand:+ start:238 stop:453 length:216 start_codon:yes stop_codon:yes gene_type:complete